MTEIVKPTRVDHEYRQVFDEAKQKWVLKKMPVEAPPKNRRVHAYDAAPPGDQQCLTCGQTYNRHYYGRDNYIVCDTEPFTLRYFTW